MGLGSFKSKEIVTGILVITGVIGSIYNGFAPESEARWTYSTLAPDIDMILDQSDKNAELIAEQGRSIIRLETKVDILQKLVVGQLASQGLIHKKAKKNEYFNVDMIRNKATKENHKSTLKTPPQRPMLNAKRRARPKAPWLQQAE